MNYTNDKNQIVFIKDGDIIANLDGTTISNDVVLSNGVPSFDLLSTLYQQLTAYDDNLSVYIRDVIGLSAENLSTEISTVVAVVDSNGNKYNHLSVFELTNAQYNTLQTHDMLAENAIYVIKDTYTSMRGQQIKDVAEPTELSDATTKKYVDDNDTLLRNYSDDISLSVNGLSSTLSSLINRDKKDVSYFGNVELKTEYPDPDHSSTFLGNKLYGLLLTNNGDSDRALHAGFMFKAVAENHLSSYEITDGTNSQLFRDNDYIIVQNEVDTVQNVALSDVTVIKDYDLSVYLIQNQIDNVNLSIGGLDADIMFLSNDLSVYKNDIGLSVDGLSGTLSALINRDKQDVTYLGEATLSDVYEDPEHEGSFEPNNKLYTLLYTNKQDKTRALHPGFLFRAASEHVLSDFAIYDSNGTQKILHNNDYLLVKSEVDALSNVSFDDLDIIKDYDLSVHLLQNQINSINLSIDGIDADVTFLSNELSTTASKLASDIKDIQDDVRGGVNYKGHIDLDKKLADEITPKYRPDLDLSAIFGIYLSAFDTDGNYVDNKSMNNGWLYNITTSAEYITHDGISFENNDYVIIHSHSLSSVDVSALVRDNIDIIEAVQDDYVRLYQHQQLSVSLSTEIDTLSSKLSGEVDGLSTSLSTTVDTEFLLSAEAIDIIRGTLTEEIRILSVKLSNDIEDLSVNLSTDISALSVGISSDVKTLSNALSVEIRTLSTNLSTDVDALQTSLSTTVNSDYIHISGDSGIGVLSLTSDLSAAGDLTLGSNSTFTKLQVKHDGTIDYTINNDSIARRTFEIGLQTKSGTLALTSDVSDLSDSLSSTAHKEVEDLSSSLSATVNDEFIHLSGDEGIGALGLTSTLSVAKDMTLGDNNSSFKFNVNSDTGKLQYTIDNNDPTSTTFEIGLQSKDGTVALTSDVDDLSTTIDEHFLLSSEAVEIIQGTLLNRINALSNDISANTNAILSNDNDINYLSAQLSTVADDHYYKTLSSIYHDDCPDNLLVTDHTDELHHKNYVMLFKYGTLVLSSIN